MCSQYVGVDWATGSWVAVGYSSEQSEPTADVFETVEELWTQYGETATRIVVDVPIGLCDAETGIEASGERSRKCDSLARAAIGSRWSSVFTPPARKAAQLAAGGASYAEVNETNKEVTGKGLTQQAANISAGIVAVDELLRGEADPEIVLEGHPEVCFRALAGHELAYSKHTAAGIDERLSILEDVPEYEPGTWRQVASMVAASGHRVGIDDLLDAFALALTACASSEEFRRLPADPPTDAEGLPMQMVYRSETEL